MKQQPVLFSILFILIIILLNRIPFDYVIANCGYSRFITAVLSKIRKNSIVVLATIWLLWKYKIPIQLINGVSYRNLIYFAPLLFFVILLMNGNDTLNKLGQVKYSRLSLFSIDVFIAALMEEIVFRGLILGLIIQKFINRRHGILLSVLITGFIFGAIHLINYWTLGDVTLRNILNQAYAAIGLSILFSSIYLKKSKSLALDIDTFQY